jgi:DNA uptake protein ComE-like DNA-binding protein
VALVAAAALLALLPLAPAAKAQAQATPSPHVDVTQGSAFTPDRARIDINVAASKDLQLLKGVGPKRAAAIIAGRPYRAGAELVERGIVPADMYEGMKDSITAGPTR